MEEPESVTFMDLDQVSHNFKMEEIDLSISEDFPDSDPEFEPSMSTSSVEDSKSSASLSWTATSPAVPAGSAKVHVQTPLQLPGGSVIIVQNMSAPVSTAFQGHVVLASQAGGSTAASSSQGSYRVRNLQRFQIPKYLFNKNLCRICLLEKEETTSLFEATNDAAASLNNMTRLNGSMLLEAIRVLFNIMVEKGDGLPEQICADCMDGVVQFSVLRNRSIYAQEKLKDLGGKGSGVSNPMFIPALGAEGLAEVNVFKYPMEIMNAKKTLEESEWCHLVRRKISDRVWEFIYYTMAKAVSSKWHNYAKLQVYICDKPYANGFVCRDCNKTVQGGAKEYLQHRKGLHKEIEEECHYPCDICGLYVKGLLEEYAHHWISHLKPYLCDVCGVKAANPRLLTVHKRNHKEVCFTCGICQKNFAKKEHYENHMKSHPDVDTHCTICAICNQILTVDVDVHMQKSHPNHTVAEWSCDVCEKVFSNKDNLISHRKDDHPELKLKFRCELCGEKFDNKRRLELHVNKHTGERPFSCDICSKRCTSKNSLNSHRIMHSEGTFKCPEDGCGKVFKRQRYLQEHAFVHTGEKPHTCPICGKNIRMRGNYYKHLRVHKAGSKAKK